MAKALYADWDCEKGAAQLREWAACGLTDTEIARKIGVSRKTLYEWAKRYSRIGEALRRGKQQSNDEVEGALYRKCVGYTVPVRKIHKVRRTEYDASGRKIEHEELVEKSEDVYVEPDTAAIKFWLTNRAPERWQSRVEPAGEASGTIEDLIRRSGTDGERAGEESG